MTDKKGIDLQGGYEVRVEKGHTPFREGHTPLGHAPEERGHTPQADASVTPVPPQSGTGVSRPSTPTASTGGNDGGGSKKGSSRVRVGKRGQLKRQNAMGDKGWSDLQARRKLGALWSPTHAAAAPLSQRVRATVQALNTLSLTTSASIPRPLVASDCKA